MVCWVVVWRQQNVHSSVDTWPTNRKSLVDPQVQEQWKIENPCLARLGAHDPVRRCQNSGALADVRDLQQIWVGDPLSMGDQEPKHCIALRPTKHDVADKHNRYASKCMLLVPLSVSALM
jgi:hypothetical protein